LFDDYCYSNETYTIKVKLDIPDLSAAGLKVTNLKGLKLKFGECPSGILLGVTFHGELNYAGISYTINSSIPNLDVLAPEYRDIIRNSKSMSFILK
jgi:hypothetical protein